MALPIMVAYGATFAILTIVLMAPPGWAQDAPLSLPLHDPAYLILEGLENMGCAAARVSPYRPYDVPRIRAAIRAAADEPTCAPALVAALSRRFADGVLSSATPQPTGDPAQAIAARGRPNAGVEGTIRATSIGRGEFRPLWDDLRPTEQGDPVVVGVLRVRARYAPTTRTVGVIEGFAQSHSRNDPLIRGRTLRSTSGVVGIDEATFSGMVGPVIISFGRDREAWLGRGSESLVLSANSPPLDRIMAALVLKRFEARALYAMLSDVVLDTLRGELPSGTPSQRFHRSMAAHALTWRPTRAFEITVGETVLLSRGSRTLELGYANPLMPFIVTQHDAGSEGLDPRTNLTAFVGVQTRVGRARVVGELLVDDIQIDAGDRELTPNQLVWRVEARHGWGAALPGSVGVEYERVDSYTYLRGLYTDVYQFLDRPIGSELGPDADRLQGLGELWLGAGSARVSTHLGVWRRGAQRISRRPAIGAVGNAGQPYPTTTTDRPFVQRALLGGVAVELFRWDIPLVARADVARIDHPGNTSGGNNLYVRATLSASYRFRYP